MDRTPVVFLCHASEDKLLARRIAEGLVEAGIDIFFDEWEIRSGDSLRQKIDHGLEGCTHFVALLTPNSQHKSWVNAEMDAGFVRKVDGVSRFIPLRYELEVSMLPPLLRGMHSPSLDNYEDDFRQLVADIYEVSRKPIVGTPPLFVHSEMGEAEGLSTAAAKIAIEFIRRSEHGRYGDRGINVKDLLAATELLEDDLAEGVEELAARSLVKPISAAGFALGYYAVIPTSRLFAELDSGVMEWVTREDAVRMAADLVNGEGHMSVPHWAEEVGWQARRVNPALTYLMDRDLVEHSNEVSQPFISNYVSRNVRTRRFVREDT